VKIKNEVLAIKNLGCLTDKVQEVYILASLLEVGIRLKDRQMATMLRVCEEESIVSDKSPHTTYY
jgi:hypothetical protein